MAKQRFDKIVEWEFTPLILFGIVALLTSNPWISLSVMVVFTVSAALYDLLIKRSTTPYLKRLFNKAIAWDGTPLIIGFSLVGFLTGNLEIAFAVALVVMILIAVYERFAKGKSNLEKK